MAITYTWSIQQMQCYPHSDEEQNVVFNVCWTLTGVDGDGIESSFSNQTPVTYSSESPFTPYNELTEAQVIGWVQDVLGPEVVVEFEARVADQIEQIINPPVVSPPLPWA